MELIKAQKLAKSLIEKHLSKNWIFKFDRGLKRAGSTQVKRNITSEQLKITLFKTLTLNRSEDEVKNTILHEIAHAKQYELRGTIYGHDEDWKRIFLSLGGDGEKYFNNKEAVQKNYKWIAYCSKCNKNVGGWFRKPKRICLIHKNCGGVIIIKKAQ